MPSKFPPHGRGSRPRKCRECGRLRTPSTPISARGLCEPCRRRRMAEPARQMMESEGPYFDAYRVAMVEYAQRLIATG